MMNNKLFLISLLISLSVQIFGQDVVPRQALIDKMSSFEDSMKKDKDDNPEFIKIPIIIDSTEGWEWIDKEECEDVFEAYPLRLSYNKYQSHPQYRVIGDEVYNGKGQLVRVVNIFDSNRRPISQRVTDELLRQTYINDYKTNKYNFKKENQNAQNYVKQELKLIKSSRFYWSKEGVGYLQQLEFDHADCAGQEFPSAHHHSYHQCHRQKDLALEIVEYKGGTNMAKITKEQYEFALSHRSPVDICRADE